MKLLNARGACAAILAAWLVAGCGGFSEYHIDIQQGNVVSKESLAQLRQGMTRDQVRFLLGTPMLQDVFHADRWDYVYRLDNRQVGTIEESKLAIFFDKDGRVARWEGNVPASGTAVEERQRLIEIGSGAAR